MHVEDILTCVGVLFFELRVAVFAHSSACEKINLRTAMDAY
jgi:hypothetical protein